MAVQVNAIMAYHCQQPFANSAGRKSQYLAVRLHVGGHLWGIHGTGWQAKAFD